MASPSLKTKKIISHFIQHLREHISISKVYLYGSSARGNARAYSDIDLAIISSDFEEQTHFERLVFLGKVAWEANTPTIEAVGYTPKEFAIRSPLEFPSEIKAHGIPINIKKAA